MPSKEIKIRFLLDEHYPGWLADALTGEGIDTVALIAHRLELRGANDLTDLETAVAEGRVVVTEDVTTFRAAIAQLNSHLGVVFCHHACFSRTRPGLEKLRRALGGLARRPPDGLGQESI